MEAIKIKWRKDMDTGVSLIDKQHREFISLVNKFLNSSIRLGDVGMLADSFTFLKYYISEHFSVEESAMSAYSYPFYATHKDIHDSFRKEIDGMELSMMTNGSLHEMAIKLSYLIVNWFTNHIRFEDMKLSKYLLAMASENKEVLSDKLDIIAGVFFKRVTVFPPNTVGFSPILR